METYISQYVKEIASGDLLCDTGSSTWCSDNREEWDGVGGERETQEGRDICIPMVDSH